jgi:hypothetical protein
LQAVVVTEVNLEVLDQREEGNMRFWSWNWGLVIILCLGLIPGVCLAAYEHQGEQDAGVFIFVYPDKAGTKLDSCNLCHSGGQYVDSKGKTVNLGSCQWCHYTYGYDKHGDIQQTLNPYGSDYLANGRNSGAITAIESFDSDKDGYSNKVEIAAVRFPGDPSDDPSKVTAPYRVFSRANLEKLPLRNQFMVMNASKSTDLYAEYTGVSMEYLLKQVVHVLPSATDIKVAAPDGFSQFHPLDAVPDPLLYQVYGAYPRASYYYDEVADISKNADGWVDYSAPSCSGRIDGDIIVNDKPLRMLLAFKRDGEYLTTGVLTPDNKLDGEGPFRIVPPQKKPGPPDQRSTATNQSVDWPYAVNADHNSGFSTRSATIIKVEPLPIGTTDINTLEAGWDFVDKDKIIIYGAIDPSPTIKAKFNELIAMIESLDAKVFKNQFLKSQLRLNVRNAKWFFAAGQQKYAVNILKSDILPRIDGCKQKAKADANDWITDCNVQKQAYWAGNEILVLLDIH